MGSFNMICFASNRTIANSNKVFIFPISQKSTYKPVKISLGDCSFEQYGIAHTGCYPDAFWGYAGPMLQGKYDDYGCVDLTDSASNKENLIQFFNILHTNLFKVEQGENSIHDLPIDFQSLYEPGKNYTFQELTSIWNTVWAVGAKNRLFINENGKARQLKFAMMHYKAASFFEAYTSSLTRNDLDIEASFDALIKKQSAFILAHIESLSVYPDMQECTMDVLKHFSSLILNIQGFYFSANWDYYDLYGGVDQLIEFAKTFKNKNPKATEFNQTAINQVKKLVAVQLKHYKINVGLDHYNIKLSPMTNGYQDYSNEVGKNYLEFIQAVNGK